MTKNEFLDYTALDDTQAKMLLEKIESIAKAYQSGRIKTHCELVLEPPIPAEEVEKWEAKHLVKLPEDYKWFITRIGRHFCPHPGSYSLHDIDYNQDYFHNFEDCEEKGGPEFPYRSLDCTLFIITFDGCTFRHALGTHEWDYGKVYPVCYDVLSEEVCFVETKEEYEKYMKEYFEDEYTRRAEHGSSEVGQSFLTFFKSDLYDLWEKLSATADNHEVLNLSW